MLLRSVTLFWLGHPENCLLLLSNSMFIGSKYPENIRFRLELKKESLVKVLDTPSGRLIKSLYESGHKLGVSSRGWASLRDLPGKQYKCIMDNFELITFDFVTEPSTRGAWLLPHAAPYPGPVPPQRRMEEISRFGLGALPMHTIRHLPYLADFQATISTYAASIKQVLCIIGYYLAEVLVRSPLKLLISII